MVELSESPDGSIQQAYAGDTFNTTVYLQRVLGSAVTTKYVSAVGKDPLSAKMLGAWREEGVATDLVRFSETRLPGLYWIETDADGEREFLYWREHSAARELLAEGHAKVLERQLADEQVVYFSAITLAILSPADRRALLALIAALRSHGVKIAFDSNYREPLWDSSVLAGEVTTSAFAISDLVLASFSDEQRVFGDRDIGETSERIRAIGVPEIVIRDGPRRCLMATPATSGYLEPNQARVVVDTTGAGDAFNAAYLATRVTGGSMLAATQAGHSLAGESVAYRGGVMPRASTPMLKQLLTGTGRSG